MNEPIKEYEEEKARYEARNNLLESDLRILSEKYKNMKKNYELAKKDANKKEADILNIGNYIDLTRCDSCELLVPTDNTSYVGNERICEECLRNGYGK